jgi:hypothetical protein
MRVILLSVSLFTTVLSGDLCSQELSPGTGTLWHTADIQHYDAKKELTPLEAEEIIKTPIYMELEKGRDEFRTKHFEITTGIKVTQLSQNTASAVLIGSANMFPTVQMKGTWWATRWLGFDAEWNKSIVVMLGSKQDPNVPNSTLISPYWIDLGTRLRYQFGNRDGSSFMAFKFGYHIHEFPVLTYPQYISKDSARGFYVGGQRRLAFNQHFGLDMGLDLLILSQLLDKSIVPNSQSGIGLRFNVDFVATIVDRTGLTTLVSFGYGQTTYISNLVGNGVSGDSRSLVNADHFEQSYSDLHLTFTARI